MQGEKMTYLEHEKELSRLEHKGAWLWGACVALFALLVLTNLVHILYYLRCMP